MIIQHLLPRARALNIMVSKRLREFFVGLYNGIFPAFKEFIDQIFLDVFPQSTRQITEWEAQLGLMNTSLSENSRRTRLEGTWQALGGQSPSYIQNTLRGNGFDVYVHEAWELPRPEPSSSPVYRNPLTYLQSGTGGIIYNVACGEPLALCGEATAQAGNSNEPQGYPLVNKIFRTEPDLVVLCGDTQALCGEPDAQAGNYNGFISVPQEYNVPSNPDTYPYYLYIGGVNFPGLATVASNRRDELESLLLQICPAHIWIGVLVNYS